MSKGCDGNTLEHDWLGLRERERDRASKSKRLVQVGALSIVPLLLSIKTIAEFHNKPPSVCLAKEREWRALLFTHRILDVDIITKSNRYVCVCGPTAITGYELSRPKMCVGFGFKTLSSSPREYLCAKHLPYLVFTIHCPIHIHSIALYFFSIVFVVAGIFFFQTVWSYQNTLRQLSRWRFAVTCMHFV